MKMNKNILIIIHQMKIFTMIKSKKMIIKTKIRKIMMNFNIKTNNLVLLQAKKFFKVICLMITKIPNNKIMITSKIIIIKILIIIIKILIIL